MDRLSRLTDAAVDLGKFGQHLVIGFEVQRLANPSVVWINRLWFREHGIELGTRTARARIEDWLLREFAFAIRDPRDPADAYLPETRLATADRYGSTDGGPNGGSARVATFGAFQVKGIGITPLAGAGTRWEHSQGWAGLEEALSEAVFGQIVAEEFPFGSTPPVAVLDAGLWQHAKEGGPAPYRRALVVRPTVLRLAHLQRATLFRPKVARAELTPALDTERTNDVVRAVGAAWRSRTAAPGIARSFEALATRLAAQAAFGEVQRVFYGGMFSSNVALDGSLFDFGASRALPTWARVTVHPLTRGFGGDLHLLDEAIESVGHYLSKVVGYDASQHLARRAGSALHRAYRRYRDLFFRQLWGAEGDAPRAHAEAVAAQSKRYFASQQKILCPHNDRLGSTGKAPPWAFAALAARPAGGAPADARQLWDTLTGGWDRRDCCADTSMDVQCACRAVCLSRLLRLTSPRMALDRSSLAKRLIAEALAGDQSVAPDPRRVEQAVTRLVGESRRVWRRLPMNLIVRAQRYEHGTSVLRCLVAPDLRSAIWLEGRLVQGTPYFLDRVLPKAESGRVSRYDHAGRWSRLYDVDELTRRAQDGDRYARAVLRVAEDMQLEYASVDESLLRRPAPGEPQPAQSSARSAPVSKGCGAGSARGATSR